MTRGPAHYVIMGDVNSDVGIKVIGQTVFGNCGLGACNERAKLALLSQK